MAVSASAKRAAAGVLVTSEELVQVAGELPSARHGAAALALALGRLCGAAGVDLDAAVALARVAATQADPVQVLLGQVSPLGLSEEALS
jgi:hypothetical protein